MGEGVAELILQARRDGGPFVDFYDFCERVDPIALNKRTIESLVKAGAFDSLGHPRQGLLLVFEQIVDRVLRRRRERDQGTLSFFDLDPTAAPGGLGGDVFDERLAIPEVEFDKAQQLAFEKEMLGLYVSDHPLLGARRILARHADCTISEVLELDDGSMRTVAGIVSSLTRKYTKRGDLMATFVLEDLGATVECMVFPKTMQNYGELLAPDVIITGEGQGRRSRRLAQADRDGDHPTGDRARLRTDGAAAGASHGAQPPTGSTACTRSCARIRATAPSSCTSSVPTRKPC